MRRAFIHILIALIGLFAATPLWADEGKANEVKATRLWPSPEYSRVAFELGEAASYKYFSLNNPDRLVLDLDGVEPNAALLDMCGKVSPSDPQIASIKVGKNRPGVTRVVIALKTAVRAQIFPLKPMGDYGHRLVVDIYPANQDSAAEKPADTAVGKAAKGVAEQEPVKEPKAATGIALAGKDAKSAKPEYVRLITVAVDAGHGGEDPGAKGANGSHEKDITLSIARRLKTLIDKQENMRAFLTRDGDYFIPLQERVNKARRAQADLFVSIHADAFAKSHARGSSVFALSEKGATSAAAKWLARHENEADLIGGVNIDVKDPYLKQTLIDLSQTQAISDSLRLGRAVLTELGGINQLHKGQVEQAGFAVLKAPDIPSILVETAFISNPDEEKRLTDEAYQDTLANAIVAGIKHYFEKNPPLARNKVAQSL